MTQSVGWSVGWLVGRLVGWSVGPLFTFFGVSELFEHTAPELVK